MFRWAEYQMLVVYVLGFMQLVPGPVSTFLKKVIVYYSEVSIKRELTVVPSYQ